MSGALQAVFQNQRSFGGGGPLDAQFNYVTMLLHGDGTNATQNNTFLDSSTNNFTITRNGNTTQGSFSPYGSNWSNYLSSSSYLSAPSNASFDFGTGDFTLECWIFASSVSTTYQSIYQFGDAASTSGFHFLLNTNTICIRTNNSQPLTTSGTLTANTWNHVALTRASSTTKLFINGVTSGGTYSWTASLSSGTSRLIGNDIYGNPYTGYISNARIVKGTAVYTSNFTPSTTPLTAITNTSLLTCQSNRFIDNSTNNFTITPSGTPTVQRFNPFGASTAYSTSVIGGSGYFDGTGDYLTVPSTSGQLSSGDFTIECWSYLISRAVIYPCIWSNYSVFTTGALGIFAGHNSATITKYQIALNGAFPVIESTASIIYNQWTHIALVRSGSTVTLYLNGVANGTFSSSATLNGTSGISYVGATGDALTTSTINGYLSNFRVVVGTAVYTSAFTPPTTPLTAITNTRSLLNYTNGAIFDNAMINDLETVGNAQISTSVVKYGTGSLAFDGTGDWLKLRINDPTLTFGSGDFTIEGWVYLTSTSGNQYFVVGTCDNSTVAGSSFDFGVIGAVGANIYIGGSTYTAASPSPTLNTWGHVAYVRNGTSFKTYLNGTQVGSTTLPSGGVINAGTTNPGAVGANGAGLAAIFGYIDDLRITKGYARYTANFTPPTAAFPDIGPT